MSIKPLDLQTLFMQMAKVGKEQSTIQKSVENQQAREASHLIKEENDRDHSVNKSEEDKKIDGVKDGSSNNKGENSGHREKEDENSEEETKYFTDPERGHNIDISG